VRCRHRDSGASASYADRSNGDEIAAWPGTMRSGKASATTRSGTATATSSAPRRRQLRLPCPFFILETVVVHPSSLVRRPSSLVRQPNPRSPLHHLQIATSHECPNFPSASSATSCPPPWLLAPGIQDPTTPIAVRRKVRQARLGWRRAHPESRPDLVVAGPQVQDRLHKLAAGGAQPVDPAAARPVRRGIVPVVPPLTVAGESAGHGHTTLPPPECGPARSHWPSAVAPNAKVAASATSASPVPCLRSAVRKIVPSIYDIRGPPQNGGLDSYFHWSWELVLDLYFYIWVCK
jgi:hypothetical protein